MRLITSISAFGFYASAFNLVELKSNYYVNTCFGCEPDGFLPGIKFDDQLVPAKLQSEPSLHLMEQCRMKSVHLMPASIEVLRHG